MPPRSSPRPSLRFGLVFVVVALALSGCMSSTSTSQTSASTPQPSSAPTTQPVARKSSSPTAQSTRHPVFAFYYLWWDTEHWHARLGPNYPYSAVPAPLPATLSGNGCRSPTTIVGNQLTDVASPLWTQDDPKQIQPDVSWPHPTGLAGFAVSWVGTGQPHQTATSSKFNHRLATLVAAVHQINQRRDSRSLSGSPTSRRRRSDLIAEIEQ